MAYILSKWYNSNSREALRAGAVDEVTLRGLVRFRVRFILILTSSIVRVIGVGEQIIRTIYQPCVVVYCKHP